MSDLEEFDPEIEKDEKDEESIKINKLPSSISKKLPIEYDNNSDDDDNDDDDDDDDEVDEEEDLDEDLDEDIPPINLSAKKDLETEYIEPDSTSNLSLISPVNSDVESDDENYLQKFDEELRDQYIDRLHPECLVKNTTEVEHLTLITRDKNGNIIDDNHRTIPFLTKYEKTRILGQRAKQINSGDQPYIDVPHNIIDGYLIAQLELKEKKLPFIIRRPLPNKQSEYWKLHDLELL